MSANRTSLIGILVGWIAALGYYVAADILYPPPPTSADDAPTWVLIDMLFVVVYSPIALALGLVLRGFCARLGRTPRLWQAPLWSLCGGALGNGLLILFFLPWWQNYFPWWQDSLPLSVINWGSVAGFVAFTIAFALCYRGQAAISNSPLEV